ncbi:hypothetical protein NC653_026908 [Populus alba x Populus x berolinensis]|uniref:Uncharacterized protein n=1 Tax=Populus alba x Populus x berolinensis TaxID=444605 RepID=A0AAD6M442_9ROSI|nr:hypothetical protein NC653_026908 [Populus alba x Populus x berolinensis]
MGVKKSSKGGGQFWFFLSREGSRFGLSLAKRGCWPRGREGRPVKEMVGSSFCLDGG